MKTDDIETMEFFKQQAHALWNDIVELGKKYRDFYEDAFLSDESNGKTRFNEKYTQDDLPF